VTLAALDEAGNAATRSWAVTVDTAGPVLKPTATPGSFSPNGDGSGDTAVLAWTANEKATGWARIYRGTTLVRSWSVSGLTSWKATWNGRDAAGAAVKDGRYTFKVRGVDAAGNRRTVSARVVVDRTASTLRWAGNLFPQDGDALRPTSALSWKLTRSATTTLRIYDATGTLVRTAWTGRDQAAGARGWTWNGRDADGSFVPQGRYTARLTVTSSLGTQHLVQPVWAAAFAITPSATKVRPGQTLTVTVASIETLTTRPAITFTQPGRAGVKVTATRLSNGTFRASFRVAAGPAGAGSIRVSAKDTDGRVNRTTLAITIGAR
jgi:flagellar hook assembly protein FlgD